MIREDEGVRRRKQSLRAEIRKRRVELPDKELLSRAIWKRLVALPEYEQARRVVLYIDHRSEVRTWPFLGDVWHAGKQVVVPYCENGQLGLFPLEHVDELEPGMLGILEPRPDLRRADGRAVRLESGDLIVVPGVAFDRLGGRIGQGAGYYDRLLARAPAGVAYVAVAFECQLVDTIPVLPHDVHMQKIVTESAVYEAPRLTP